MNRTDGPLLVGAVDSTTGATVPLKRNAAGELIVTSGGASGSTVDLISVGGAPIALGQDNMAGSFPVVIASDQSAVHVIVDSGGGSNASVGATGAAVPASATLTGYQDSTGDLAPVVLEADGSIPVTVVAGGGANASVAATGGAVPASATYIGVNVAGNLTGAAAGNGTAAGALRVTVANDSTGVLATVGAVTAITNALPAGNNNIGDVDVASVTGNVTVVQPTGTNLHTVIDSGTLTTVSTVTSVTAIANALPAGNNNIGDVDVASVVPGTGATNLGKAEDSGHTSTDVGVFALAVRQDSPDTAVTNTTADYSQISVSSTGALRNAPMSEDFAALANGPQVKKYYTNAGAVTDGIIWSPASGKRWYVTDIFITISAAATITLEDDLAGGDSPVWKAELAANSGWSHSFNTPLFSGEDAADLIITTSAGNVYVTVTGYEI